MARNTVLLRAKYDDSLTLTQFLPISVAEYISKSRRSVGDESKISTRNGK